MTESSSPVGAVGVLVPHDATAPQLAPEALPFGRAALRLAEEGNDVVFGVDVRGGRLSGLRAVPGGWRMAEGVAVCAFYDRFPSQARAAEYEAIRRQVGGVPVANGTAATLLCRDKLKCQRVLEAHGERMPEVSEDVAAFAELLREWGRGFLKPRFGSCGRGVRPVVPGDPLPAFGESMLPGRPEPMLLQRAVPPPPGWAGVSMRVLVQRAVGDAWVALPGAARVSRADPVVNADRGATVLPARSILSEPMLEACIGRARKACEALQARLGQGLLIEAGVDFVVDANGEPHIIEVNGRPRGRLGALAQLEPDRFAELHRAACERPLRYLAWRFGLPRAPSSAGIRTR